MKRPLILCGVILAVCISALGQTKLTTNFGGAWELDVSKSKLPEPGQGGGGGGFRGASITAQTLTISQDDKHVSITTDTKADREIPSSTVSYNVDGSESTTELNMGRTPVPAKIKLKALEGGKIELHQDANIDTPNGAIAITNVETWELADGGKTLKVHRTRTSPRGTQESDWVFIKK